MSEPTQTEKCADLARVIYPSAEITEAPLGGVDVRVYDKPNETRSWYGFNPYADHTACHVLLVWLAADDALWDYFESALTILLLPANFAYTGAKPDRRAMMTADIAIIAEAAWQAIQEQSND